MLSMLADPALSDVCLVTEGVDVPAHKAVLGEKKAEDARLDLSISTNPSIRLGLDTC